MSATPEERELYEALRHLPDFDCMPIPNSWFKKFGIPPRNPLGPREYIQSNYAMTMAYLPKDLPPLVIDEPQDGGRLVTVPKVEDAPVTIVSRPFEMGKSFPAVLPSLTDASLLTTQSSDPDTRCEPDGPLGSYDHRDGTSERTVQTLLKE